MSSTVHSAGLGPRRWTEPSSAVVAAASGPRPMLSRYQRAGPRRWGDGLRVPAFLSVLEVTLAAWPG